MANCNRRDALTLAMKQPARPASRSRAASASHQSWAAFRDLLFCREQYEQLLLLTTNILKSEVSVLRVIDLMHY